MNPFALLHAQWPTVYAEATRAAAAAYPDPRAACFYARRALELTVKWLYTHDGTLKLPYEDRLSALLHEPTFKTLVGETIFNKARVITRLGNHAVHSDKAIPPEDALTAVGEFFHVAYWLARTYGADQPPPELHFDPTTLPKAAPLPKQTRAQLQQLQEDLAAKDEKLTAILASHHALDAELQQLRAEIAAIKAANRTTADTHDYNETQTRDYFIDLLLKEAGWPLDQARDREVEVHGMPNATDVGYVDYVLWGDDGLPLALVEAKRTRRDPTVGQQQAKLYADCLEARFGRRPIIFYTNGYDHWLWDDLNYPPRSVQGFYKKSELELMIQRRSSRQPLTGLAVNSQIVERHYQTRAIRHISEAFAQAGERKALLVMATGAGKTRTVIALVDLLLRANWVKRVLFLADRVALVKQAANAFKTHLPNAAPVNLLTNKLGEGRVYFSTYPTMMGLIDEAQDGQRRFGVGHFDLVIIDEAHRSVFQKYRAIFDYFDALLVGLTATPKDEVDRNTYALFDLQPGVPTDAYALDDAVADGYLVPAKAISVPLKFQREGIRYADLSEEEKDAWDALEWGEDGPPEVVSADALNTWLFNTDTVDKVLAYLMTHGLKVEGGDRLGKTIIFAKNQAHADFIAQRFDVNYPHFNGHFARAITYQTAYAQSLIDDFSQRDQPPHIAISVDMLDTGIDVPEVANLVLFKVVHAKTKFWQMLGRGTRLCPDLFGPHQDKRCFYLFDFCQNLEYFSQELPTSEAPLPASLSQRLFQARLELVTTLRAKLPAGETGAVAQPGQAHAEEPGSEQAVVDSIVQRLQTEVAAMNLDNFLVRPRRKLVEQFAAAEAWQTLRQDEVVALATQVAGLPSALATEPETAKRFDWLMLTLQLALLRADPGYTRLRDQVMTLAGQLVELAAIPMVQGQLPLIAELQSEAWWQDVTVPMLEIVRLRLRELVGLIEYRQREPIYTNFEDELGITIEVPLPGLDGFGPTANFRAKAQAYLRKRQDHIVIARLRKNVPLTPTDLEELARILVESGIGTQDEVDRAAAEAQGLGLFVRSLVGLDRQAAKAALSEFLDGKTLSANQIAFVNKIVDHLTQHGVMEAARLYESPFTDLAAQGPDSIFTSQQVDELITVLRNMRAAATG